MSDIDYYDEELTAIEKEVRGVVETLPKLSARDKNEVLHFNVQISCSGHSFLMTN
jgi:hypothetical protein